jgi:hypothetical protein
MPRHATAQRVATFQRLEKGAIFAYAEREPTYSAPTYSAL